MYLSIYKYFGTYYKSFSLHLLAQKLPLNLEFLKKCKIHGIYQTVVFLYIVYSG